MATKIPSYDSYKPRNNIWFPELVYPDPAHTSLADLIEFWKGEKDKLLNGFYLADGAVHVSGWLYWHTVYWTIEMDIMLPDGVRSVKKEGTPTFRDLEWEHQINLGRGESESKGWMTFGSRGFGKTNLQASTAGYFYTMYDNLEVVISAGDKGDIAMATSKTEMGLSCLPVPLRKKRIENDWSRVIRAGYKDKEGTRKGSNSRIVMRTFSGGSDSMACNGTRPKFHIIDEVGKFDRLQDCYDDSKACWMNDFGQFGIPFLTGTGGDMEKGEDAMSLFYNPFGNNLLEFDDIWEARGKIGNFVPATKARNEFKDPKTLGEFLGIAHPDLERVHILVSNEERCMEEFIKPRRARAEASGRSSSIIKEKAYYPIVPSEMFLRLDGNPFPVEAAEQHLQFLLRNNMTGQNVELYRDVDNKVKHKFSDKHLPISSFPYDGKGDPTGAITIYEFPIPGTHMLYVAGADPLAHSNAVDSTSVGTVVIFKRMTDVTGETYQNMMVAQYAGRPEQLTEFHNTVELLMEFYNAVCMPENENSVFIQHFELKNKSHWLADGLNFLREISPTSSVLRNKGLPPTAAVIRHCMNLMVEYCKEKLTVGQDDNGNPVTRLGITRILDPMLLKEIIAYHPKANVDRIVAFRHALAYANSLDRHFPIIPVSDQRQEDRRTQHVASPFVVTRRDDHMYTDPFHQRNVSHGTRRGGGSPVKSPFTKNGIKPLKDMYK